MDVRSKMGVRKHDCLRLRNDLIILYSAAVHLASKSSCAPEESKIDGVASDISDLLQTTLQAGGARLSEVAVGRTRNSERSNETATTNLTSEAVATKRGLATISDAVHSTYVVASVNAPCDSQELVGLTAQECEDAANALDDCDKFSSGSELTDPGCSILGGFGKARICHWNSNKDASEFSENARPICFSSKAKSLNNHVLHSHNKTELDKSGAFQVVAQSFVHLVIAFLLS
mmetsp:Transcript_63266/g.100314  ORF Transcript_63266/g.100314 Transcript_63266/m.100314 type:complete len:232 (-) Transcript_63266:19-714(-)